jgi:transaldolase
MKFFIDTGDVAAIRDLMPTGMVDGITTNPSLAAKTGKRFRDLIAEICEVCPGPVSAEVVADTAEGMIAQAKIVRAIAPNVVVKAPLTWEGLKATRALSEAGHPVNVTLCFSANQALLAAKAGAAYISPFVGRLDDIHLDGMDLIRDIRAIYDNFGFTTEILVASIRTVSHVREAALIGADVGTMPPATLRALASHPLTDKGLAQFNADWAASGLSID